jgi:succinate-semialdehyde dehydrogenase/glutarate-semialdehyde dehydrogenase
VADEFAARLTEKLAAMKVGRGTEQDVQVGPLIDGNQRDKVAELVEDAVGKGAKVMTGGERVGETGYFYAPTVLSEISPESDLLREEIFGPVAPVATFGSEDEAIAAANSTEYGLVAYLFTRDIKRAFRVTEALDVGMLGLNRGLVSNAAAPFGGVKESGFGREGGAEGIEEYLTLKYVAVDV